MEEKKTCNAAKRVISVVVEMLKKKKAEEARNIFNAYFFAFGADNLRWEIFLNTVAKNLNERNSELHYFVIALDKWFNTQGQDFYKKESPLEFLERFDLSFFLNEKAEI